MSSGVCRRLFVVEDRIHHHRPLYEWLLEEARRSGIPGGTAFRAIAGYGRHGTLHEAAFFELAGKLPVEVDFIAEESQARSFLAMLEDEHLQLFYSLGEVEFGRLGTQTP